MSFSIPPPQIATPLDQKPKGMISPYQHQNEDLQLRVFDFYNAGKLIFRNKQKFVSIFQIEAFKEKDPGAVKEEPGEFRFYDLNDVWGLAANALRKVFIEVQHIEPHYF